MFKPIKSISLSTSTDLKKKLTTQTSTTIKQLVNKSPFVYGAKKTSFRVKRRKTFWEQVENTNQIVKQQLLKSILLDKSDPRREDITMKAVSPALALALILLNQGVVQSKTISDYVGDINDTSDKRFTPKVYALNKYTYDTDGKRTVNTTESYTPSLPQYYHIHSAWTSYGKVPEGNVDVFRTDGANTSLSQRQIDVRNYIWEQGFIKKIADNSYGNKNTDISYIRSGYGYGPVCISTFLKLAKYGKKMIPEIICGLLLCEDSGMPIKDAIQAVREFLNPGNRYSALDISYFNGLSEVMILSIIEEIGTFFLLSLLGHCYKKNIHFVIPLSTTLERNIYEVGYIIGDTVSDLRNYLIYILQNKLYKQDSIEVFSITTPCVMTTDGTVSDSILETTFDSKSFGDLSTIEDNPILSSFDISNCLYDIKEFDYMIQPRIGYTVSDFINKNLALHYIDQLINMYNNDEITLLSENVIKNNVYSDYGMAPRVEETTGTLTFDYSKCTPIYDNEYYYGNDLLQKLSDLKVEVKLTSSIKNSDLKQLGEKPDKIEDKVDSSKYSITVNISDVDPNISSDMKAEITNYIKNVITTGNVVRYKYDKLNTATGAIDQVISGTTYTITLSNTYLTTLQQNKIIVSSDKSVIFNNYIQNKQEISIKLFTHNGTSWSSNGTNDTQTLTFSISLINEFKTDIKPKLLINRLFRDNHCTLELYYKNIEGSSSNDDKMEQLNYFFDVYGLAITRIIIINCLCNQQSFYGSDMWRRFFKTFSGYLKNYVDIEVSSLS